MRGGGASANGLDRWSKENNAAVSNGEKEREREKVVLFWVLALSIVVPYVAIPSFVERTPARLRWYGMK